ncbi:hypothetical protein PHJA_001884100 [Phtheirospermum japonicum]|uniref:Uncharacterized protein n=1 Tax=Phtheirospermum japonicum TaxID=374723 RepID=A0A830CCQ9_9LAMI|nr:hypothetical protein PHJA_001884100 [Phtheirospermum japonicum]
MGNLEPPNPVKNQDPSEAQGFSRLLFCVRNSILKSTTIKSKATEPEFHPTLPPRRREPSACFRAHELKGTQEPKDQVSNQKLSHQSSLATACISNLLCAAVRGAYWNRGVWLVRPWRRREIAGLRGEENWTPVTAFNIVASTAQGCPITAADSGLPLSHRRRVLGQLDDWREMEKKMRKKRWEIELGLEDPFSYPQQPSQ